MTNDEFHERVAGRLGVDPVELEVAIETEEVLDKVRSEAPDLSDADAQAIERQIRAHVGLRREIERDIAWLEAAT